MKILFVSSDKFPPFRVDVSILFGEKIVEKGHDITWLLQSEEVLKNTIEIKWKGGSAIVGPREKENILVKKIISRIKGIVHDLKIFSISKNEKHDIILIKDKFFAGLVAIIAAKAYKMKFVYWLSFPYPEDCFFRAKQKTSAYPLLIKIQGIVIHFILYKNILKKCDHAFVQTEYMKRKINLNGIPNNLMTAVPMAVSIKDVPFYGYKKKEADNPKIVYLGSLIKNRRMDFLLRSFKKVLSDEKKALLYLVGGSENINDIIFLKEEAGKLKIEKSVIITGFLPQHRAFEYVENADVCVSPIFPSPSFDVGSPTKLLEYMAMGKASVANDHPEQKIVIDESKGGICVPYDEDSFAEAIVFLIRNRVIAITMGVNGRKYIKKKREYNNTVILVENKLKNIISK